MAVPALSLPLKLRYGAEAALFLAFMGLFRIMGVDAASALGGFIGRIIFARTQNAAQFRGQTGPVEFVDILVRIKKRLVRFAHPLGHHSPRLRRVTDIAVGLRGNVSRVNES